MTDAQDAGFTETLLIYRENLWVWLAEVSDENERSSVSSIPGFLARFQQKCMRFAVRKSD
jgi:hypothetical protein